MEKIGGGRNLIFMRGTCDIQNTRGFLFVCLSGRKLLFGSPKTDTGFLPT